MTVCMIRETVYYERWEVKRFVIVLVRQPRFEPGISGLGGA